ncbi:MAG: hypothetical protein QOE11_118 [Solirubrobacteraceae bacterium]|jgi:hypothetical protein|nr:hypothetical protein [Solirubrobacteraceae bacterium]
MHATHPHLHPRRTLLAALAALALALPALTPASLQDLSFGGTASAPAPAARPAPSAPAPVRLDPAWRHTPLSWPRLQATVRSIAGPAGTAIAAR